MKCLLSYIVFLLLISVAYANDIPLEVVPQSGHHATASYLEFSPDGSILASMGEDDTRLWNLASGRLIRVFRVPLNDNSLFDFSPDGQKIAISSYSKIYIFNVLTGELYRELEERHFFTRVLKFHPNGEILMSSDGFHMILWNIQTGDQICTQEVKFCMKMSSDGEIMCKVVTNDRKYSVETWNVMMDTLIQSYSDSILFDLPLPPQGGYTQTPHPSYPFSVEFSPDNNYLAVGYGDSTAIIWDVQSGERVARIKCHVKDVSEIAYHPNGKLLAIGGKRSGVIMLWDIQKQEFSRILEDEQFGSARNIVFSPDGKTLVSGKTPTLWNVETGEMIRRFDGKRNKISVLKFHPITDELIVGSAIGPFSINFWNIETGQITWSLEDYIRLLHLNSVLILPDNKTIVSSSGEFLTFWDIETGKEIYAHQGGYHHHHITALSPNGKYIASGSYNGSIKLFDTETKEELRNIMFKNAEIDALIFCPDNQNLICGYDGGAIIVGNPNTGEIIHRLDGISREVNSFDFSPDGKLLAAGGYGQDGIFAKGGFRIKIWKSDTFEELYTLDGHSYYINSVCFSPDNQTLASGGSDHQVRLWDLSTGTESFILSGHSASVLHVSYNSKGTILASLDELGVIKFWDVKQKKELFSFIPLYENNWIVVAPDNTFDASEQASQYVHFVQGLKVLQLDDPHSYYRPNLMSKLISTIAKN